jgi:hypothetical protein
MLHSSSAVALAVDVVANPARAHADVSEERIMAQYAKGSRSVVGIRNTRKVSNVVAVVGTSTTSVER